MPVVKPSAGIFYGEIIIEFFSQNAFDVRLEWGLLAVDYLAGKADCIVIVDAMSFSSCVSLAVEKGARIDEDVALRLDANATRLACRLYGDFYASGMT